MSKREIFAIIALLIAGLIVYEVLTGFEAQRDELAPGETPVANPRPRDDAGAMKAMVPAARATEVAAAVRVRYGVAELPGDAGLLAVAGNPGEYFFIRRQAGRAAVCVMRAGGAEVLWSTDTGRILEIVGSHGAELLLKFADRPFTGPADAWQPGGFFGLDMFAPHAGIHPVDIDDATVASIRATIR
jgi:hypothetical protein